MLPQYEEELELIEAQRDIRKAHVRAAEVAVKAAETQFDCSTSAGNNVPQMERTKARLEVEAAQAQLEIKIAEMKEVEVRIKYSKKRRRGCEGVRGRSSPGTRREIRPEDRSAPAEETWELRNEDPLTTGR